MSEPTSKSRIQPPPAKLPSNNGSAMKKHESAATATTAPQQKGGKTRSVTRQQKQSAAHPAQVAQPTTEHMLTDLLRIVRELFTQKKITADVRGIRTGIQIINVDLNRKAERSYYCKRQHATCCI